MSLRSQQNSGHRRTQWYQLPVLHYHQIPRNRLGILKHPSLFKPSWIVLFLNWDEVSFCTEISTDISGEIHTFISQSLSSINSNLPCWMNGFESESSRLNHQRSSKSMRDLTGLKQRKTNQSTSRDPISNSDQNSIINSRLRSRGEMKRWN